MYRQKLEDKAFELGYSSAYDQAFSLIKEQLPGTDHDEMSELAIRAVNKAVKEHDSISRVVALRDF